MRRGSFAVMVAGAAALGASVRSSVLARDPVPLGTRMREATERAARAIAQAHAQAGVPGLARGPRFAPSIGRGSRERTLVALTLLRAGGPEEKKLARALLDAWWAESTSTTGAIYNGTYELALGISALEGLALERLPDPRPTTVSRYEARPLRPDDARRLEEATHALIRAAVPSFGQKGLGWGYQTAPITSISAATREKPSWERELPDVFRAAAWDNSNTQFAVLALHDAARGGVHVPHSVTTAIAKHFLACAKDEVRYEAFGRTATGSSSKPFRWGYRERPDGRVVSMTFAGLSSLAIARELGAKDKEVDHAIDRGAHGLGELLKGVGEPGRSESGWGTAYRFYSLEKALDVLDIDKIEGREWFPPLAEAVLAKQGPDGLWAGDVVDSCLYVLFLTRATVSKARVVDARSTGRGAASQDSPGDVYVARLKKNVDAVELVAAWDGAAGYKVSRAREHLEDALKALVAEGHGRELCVVGPLAAIAARHDSRSSFAARWVREIAGEELAPEVARATHGRWRELSTTRDPVALRAVLATNAPLPLRAFAAHALALIPLPEAGPDVIAAAEFLATDRHLETAAGARCARAYSDALVALVGADVPGVPPTGKVSRDDVHKLAKGARERLDRALELAVARALETWSERAAEPERWRTARDALGARGRKALARLASVAEEPAHADRAFAVLRAVTGELIPDDLEAWKTWIAARP